MGDAPFTATATLDGEWLDDRAIRDAELDRARHALAYLKQRIGDAAMRSLLAADTGTMHGAGTWTGWRRRAANGERASLELVVPGPSAADFHRWYDMRHGRTARGRCCAPATPSTSY